MVDQVEPEQFFWFGMPIVSLHTELGTKVVNGALCYAIAIVTDDPEALKQRIADVVRSDSCAKPGPHCTHETGKCNVDCCKKGRRSVAVSLSEVPRAIIVVSSTTWTSNVVAQLLIMQMQKQHPDSSAYNDALQSLLRTGDAVIFVKKAKEEGESTVHALKKRTEGE